MADFLDLIAEEFVEEDDGNKKLFNNFFKLLSGHFINTGYGLVFIGTTD